MNKRFFLKSFFQIGLLPCLALLLLGLWSLPQIENILLQKSKNHLKQTVAAIAAHHHFNLSEPEKIQNALKKIFVLQTSQSNIPENHLSVYQNNINDLQTRITVIMPNGVVIADSQLTKEELKTLENHWQRPEIQQAVKQGWGESVRYSSTVKQPAVYVAQATPYGFLRASMPLAAVSKELQKITDIFWRMFIITLLLSFLIALFLGHQRYVSQLATLEFLEKIANKDFTTIFKNDVQKIDSNIAEALNKTAFSFKKALTLFEQENNQLRNILESITEGVLVTDEKGQIIFVNSALKNEFHLTADALGQTTLEYLRSSLIHECIQNTLLSQKNVQQEIDIFVGENQKIFYLNTAPVIYNELLKGSVSIFHNMTQIKQIENLRKEFVANVSHEFKTPLTSIIGYTETLQSQPDLPEPTKKFLDIIAKNGKLLHDLVQDILQIAKIESGRSQLPFVTVDVHEILQNVVRDLSPKINQRQQKIIMNFEPIQPHVRGNQQALQQIFSNLVDNAIKYTPDQGCLTLTTKKFPTHFEIAVKDNGIGIDKKNQLRIFERFYRVDSGRSREMGGTGLGLSIVKHLVQAHHGQVRVESEMGKGSTFIVSLPL